MKCGEGWKGTCQHLSLPCFFLRVVGVSSGTKKEMTGGSLRGA